MEFCLLRRRSAGLRVAQLALCGLGVARIWGLWCFLDEQRSDQCWKSNQVFIGAMVE